MCSSDLMKDYLIRLKKYKILGYETGLSLEEIEDLLNNISSSRYKDNFDPARADFLERYMGENYGK